MSTKAIRRASVELASLMKKERISRRKFNFYHRLVQDVDDHSLRIYMYTGRESHVDSNGEE